MQGIIRPMVPEDLPAVHAIETRSFAAPWSMESLRTELSNPLAHNVVLEVEGVVVANMLYWMVLDEVHLLTIAVDPPHRGNGYARFLMQALLVHARQTKSRVIYLEVRENNEPAIALYKRLGFQITGRIADYYKEEKQDAITMAKELA